MKAALLIALLPLAAEAQLAIDSVNGSAETAVGSTYQFGQVALNTTSTVQFRVYNTASAATSVNVSVGGAGFTLTSPSLPYPLPGNSTATQALNFTVSFTPSSTATFSANLQINSTSIILLGSGVAAPTLSAAQGCAGAAFNFGSVPVGQSASCTFTLLNSNPQAVTVASVVVNGLGFAGPFGVSAPFVLQAGQAASFSVQFTPPQALVYSGTLAVGSQSFSLAGTGAVALIPKPALQLDAGTLASGQQRTLTMTIPGGSPTAATGYVNLAFAPSTAVVKDDNEIVFLANGARSIPFSVAAGATQVLLNGQSSAAFQTGTTEGTITFTVSTNAALSGDPTVQFAIPGATVAIDSASASKERTGYLDITITGADNTYSTGQMSFTFLDASGNTIGSASADFSSSFKSYYGNVNSAGSVFTAVVSFPVTGSVANIGSVTATIVNAAGTASTGSLTFN